MAAATLGVGYLATWDRPQVDIWIQDETRVILGPAGTISILIGTVLLVLGGIVVALRIKR